MRNVLIFFALMTIAGSMKEQKRCPDAQIAIRYFRFGKQIHVDYFEALEKKPTHTMELVCWDHKNKHYEYDSSIIQIVK